MKLCITMARGDEEQLSALLEGLASWSAVLIDRHRLPALYSTQVRYRREDRSRPERWQGPIETLRRGEGDCEDLAAYRAAELRVYASEPARAIAIRTGSHRYHAVVRRADGRIEDPARYLARRERDNG